MNDLFVFEGDCEVGRLLGVEVSVHRLELFGVDDVDWLVAVGEFSFVELREDLALLEEAVVTRKRRAELGGEAFALLLEEAFHRGVSEDYIVLLLALQVFLPLLLFLLPH